MTVFVWTFSDVVAIVGLAILLLGLLVAWVADRVNAIRRHLRDREEDRER